MPRPCRFTPAKETRYPLHGKLGGPQYRSGLVPKILPLPLFNPPTVQPEAIAIPTELSGPTSSEVNNVKQLEITLKNGTLKNIKLQKLQTFTTGSPFKMCLKYVGAFDVWDTIKVASLTKETVVDLRLGIGSEYMDL
jgi:hypothetical protein